MASARSGSRRRLANSPFAPPVEGPPVVFAVGDRVSHDRHGLGRVRAVNEGDTVDIDFGGSVGLLRVEASSKRIQRLE